MTYLSVDSTYSTLVKTGRASMSAADKMYRAEFDFAEAVTGGYNSGNFFSTELIEFSMTDYSSNAQTVFLGFFPSGQAHYAPGNDYEKLTAFSHSWYLTKQYLPSTALVIAGSTTDSPRDWLIGIIGGTSDYMSKTGIYPYKIATVSGVWGGTKPAVEFVFQDQQTKMSAIEEVSEYLGYTFHVKWWWNGSYMEPAAYWCQSSNIYDSTDGLDLPGSTTITAPSPYLKSPIMFVQDGSERYNRVIVRGQGLASTWWTATVESAGVSTGTEIPIEYYEINPNIATSSELDTRATDLYNYYSVQNCTWKATFINRPDFRLYQKLAFSGYGAEMPNDDYVIVGISYLCDKGGTVNEQTCDLIPDSAFSAYLSLRRSFTDSVKKVQDIVKKEVQNIPKIQIGVVSSTNTDYIIGTLENGLVVTSRTVST